MITASEIWLLIALAGAITLLQRIVPSFLVQRLSNRFPPWLDCFLDAFSIAFITSVLSRTVLEPVSSASPSPTALLEGGTRLAIVAGVIVLVPRSGRPLVLFVAAVGLYAVLELMWR